jgi:pimeloyl-ACP methyl ester carboxylesterase
MIFIGGGSSNWKIKMERQVERQQLEVDGAKVSLRFWPGRGTPLVLLHGFMDSSQGFDNLARHTHRPCYAFDLPGFGSSHIAAQPSFDCYAQRICAALDQMEVEKAIWVAHSMGGAVARAACDDKQLSKNVSALALITPAGFGKLPLASVMDHKLLRPVVTGAFPLFSANPLTTILAYPSQVSGGRRPSGAMVLRTMRSAARGPQGPVMAAHALNGINHLTEQQLTACSLYKGPVASLWGEKDRLIPASHSETLKLVFPQATVTNWPDLAHHPQIEQPRRLQGWIEKAATRGRKGH